MGENELIVGHRYRYRLGEKYVHEGVFLGESEFEGLGRVHHWGHDDSSSGSMARDISDIVDLGPDIRKRHYQVVARVAPVVAQRIMDELENETADEMERGGR